MRKLVGLAAVLALMGACSKKNASLEGNWKIGTITVNGKTQPFGKDSITYHSFVAFDNCKENISSLAYVATSDSIKVTNELKRIERSHYQIKGDTLTITDEAEIRGQKLISKVKLIRMTSDK